MQVKRENCFEILRVIAMFLVIVIHVANIYSRNYAVISNSSYVFSLIFNTIARVSVPIFFMISGALLLDRKFDKKKYFKRLYKYAIIIFVWVSIYYLWEYFFFGKSNEHLYKIYFTDYRKQLWFLYAIIILYFLQPLIRNIFNKIGTKTRITLLILWFIFGTLSLYNGYISAFFTVFSYIGYFVMGKALYDLCREKDLKKYNIPLILVMIIGFSLSIFLNYTFTIKNDEFYNSFFAYRTPFISIPSFAFYILMLTNYKKEKLSNLVVKLSSLSLGVYLIHGIYLDITKKLFDYDTVHSLIGIPIYSIIVFIVSVMTINILKKIKFVKEVI